MKSLYPYNYWILYAAIVLLIVFLILTLMRAMPLLKALNTMKGSLNGINTDTASLTGKLQTIMPAEDPDKPKKKLPISASQIIEGIMLLRSIRKNYRKADGSGLKQVRTSTSEVIKKRNNDKQIQKHLKKIIGK